MSRFHKKLTTIAAVAALAFGLAACGGGGDDDTTMMEPPPPPPPPMPVAVDLMGSSDLMAGMTTIGAGDSVTVGYTTVSCAAGGEDCMLTIAQDDVTGALSASALGGTVTVAIMDPPMPPEPPVSTVVDLMGSTDLMSGMTTLQPGESSTVGLTTVSCAAGGEACMFTVMDDEVTGEQRASATGGMVTVMVADPPDPPMYSDLTLPMNNSLTSDSALDEADDSETINIAAGESVVRGGVLFSCPADGDACRVMLQNEAGTAVASYTGGTPTAMVAVPSTTVDLPDGHNLATGVVTIPAGGTYAVGGTVVSCPAGGMACTVTISRAPLGGPIVGTSSGGAATVALAPSPSWTDTRGGSVASVINMPTTTGGAIDGTLGQTTVPQANISANAQGTPRITGQGALPATQRFSTAGAAPSLAGWTGLVFERPGPTVMMQPTTQRFVVYTDRDAPMAGGAFASAFGGTGFTTNANPRTVVSSDGGFATRYGTTFAALASSESFPATPAPGQIASAQFLVNRAFPGTFAGVPGMFTCTAAADTNWSASHSESDRPMQDYDYEIIDQTGQVVKGRVRADSATDLARELNAGGHTVIEVREPRAARSSVFPRRIGMQDLIMALHELATLLESGVSLGNAVQAQVDGIRHQALAASFEAIGRSLMRGHSFLEALHAGRLHLPAYVYHLVGAGELNGQLAGALRQAVQQMQYDQRVAAELRGALFYPSILVVAGCSAVLLVFAFVIPQFSGLLENGNELPVLAAAVLRTGLWLDAHLWTLAGAVAIIGGAGILLSRRERVRQRVRDGLSSLPVIGAWFAEADTAKWASLMSAMLASRVSLMDALGIAAHSVRISRRKATLELAASDVRAGASLSAALEKRGALTPTGYSLLRVGEQSGQLAELLRALATLYDENSQRRMKRVLALIEPLAIVLVGGVLGIIMIGIILAITSVNDVAF